MLYGIVGAFAGLAKVNAAKTVTDDCTFRLHYRWTTSLCFLACALVATSDLVGAPIQCLEGGEEAAKPKTTFCWVSSTFTINTETADGEHGFYESYDSKFHGLGTHDEEKHEKRVHAYYQWVPFVLFALGCMFYLPHLLWKELESKQVDQLLQGLHIHSMDDAAAAKKKNIVQYLGVSQGRLNRQYAYGYLACHVLNLVVVVSMMFILESFFGGIFMDYGNLLVKYLNGHPDVQNNPMIEAFPRVAKCTFSQYGASGTIERHDLLCLLPQNIMNEKIFIVLWFWFVILTALTSAQIVYIIAKILSPMVRIKALERHGRMVNSMELEAYVEETEVGDCFLLLTLGRNLDALAFKDVLQELITHKKSSMGGGAEGGNNAYPPLPSSAPSYGAFGNDIPLGTYRPLTNPDEEEPVDYKRRMEAANNSV